MLQSMQNIKKKGGNKLKGGRDAWLGYPVKVYSPKSQ